MSSPRHGVLQRQQPHRWSRIWLCEGGGHWGLCTEAQGAIPQKGAALWMREGQEGWGEGTRVGAIMALGNLSKAEGCFHDEVSTGQQTCAVLWSPTQGKGDTCTPQGRLVPSSPLTDGETEARHMAVLCPMSPAGWGRAGCRTKFARVPIPCSLHWPVLPPTAGGTDLGLPPLNQSALMLLASPHLPSQRVSVPLGFMPMHKSFC